MKIWLQGDRPLVEGPTIGPSWWNAVMICNRCGLCWGRVERDSSYPWCASMALCEKCGDRWNPGASFLTELGFGGSSGCLPTTEDQVEAMLRELPGLAAYEWKVHKAWAERNWI